MITADIKNYFDWSATTPCSDEVIQAMSPYWQANFGNPDSRNHIYGWNAEKALKQARETIAQTLNVAPNEVIFTSGATEANNLAIKGYVTYNIKPGEKSIISIQTEHKCVIESLRYLESMGHDVRFLKVRQNGIVDLDLLEKNLENAGFLTISLVNNETGVIHEIDKIIDLAHKYSVILHVDAVQAFGKIAFDQINISARDFDMLSISSHKIYGPKGVGALIIAKQTDRHSRIRIAPLIQGGGQENNIRSGTSAIPLCVGFAKAAELASANLEDNYKKIKHFHDKIYNAAIKIECVTCNGVMYPEDLDRKIPHILNLSIPFVEGESLLMRLNKFALSSGSACTSKSLGPSHVITAMHPEQKSLAHSSLRICISQYNNADEVDDLITELEKNIKDLRKLSPLYDMYKDGIDLQSIKWK